MTPFYVYRIASKTLPPVWNIHDVVGQSCRCVAFCCSTHVTRTMSFIILLRRLSRKIHHSHNEPTSRRRLSHPINNALIIHHLSLTYHPKYLRWQNMPRKELSCLVAVVFPMTPNMGFVEVVHKPDKCLGGDFVGKPRLPWLPWLPWLTISHN